MGVFSGTISTRCTQQVGEPRLVGHAASTVAASTRHYELPWVVEVTCSATARVLEAQTSYRVRITRSLKEVSVPLAHIRRRQAHVDCPGVGRPLPRDLPADSERGVWNLGKPPLTASRTPKFVTWGRASFTAPLWMLPRLRAAASIRAIPYIAPESDALLRQAGRNRVFTLFASREITALAVVASVLVVASMATVAKAVAAEALQVAYVTAPRVEASSLAGRLVRNKLAACVNILPVNSVYTWEGKVENDEEALLIIKTRRSLSDQLVSFVQREHSYDVPEVIFLPIEGGSAPYMSWVREMTDEAAPLPEESRESAGAGGASAASSSEL